MLGQLERAIQDLDEAIRLDPQLAMSYANRGLAYGNLGQYQQAIQDYSEAIRLDPQPSLYYNRGTAYFHLGQHQRVIKDLDKVISQARGFAEAYAVRALAYTFLGNDREAQQDVDRALRLGFGRMLDAQVNAIKNSR